MKEKCQKYLCRWFPCYHYSFLRHVSDTIEKHFSNRSFQECLIYPCISFKTKNLKVFKLNKKKCALDWYFCILNMYIIIRDEAKQDFLKSYYLKLYLYFTLLKLINKLTLNTLLHNIKRPAL